MITNNSSTGFLPETLNEVFSHSDKASLLNARLVSKQWNEESTPHLLPLFSVVLQELMVYGNDSAICNEKFVAFALENSHNLNFKSVFHFDHLIQYLNLSHCFNDLDEKATESFKTLSLSYPSFCSKLDGYDMEERHMKEVDKLLSSHALENNLKSKISKSLYPLPGLERLLSCTSKLLNEGEKTALLNGCIKENPTLMIFQICYLAKYDTTRAAKIFKECVECDIQSFWFAKIFPEKYKSITYGNDMKDFLKKKEKEFELSLQ